MSKFLEKYWYLAAWLDDVSEVTRRLVLGVPLAICKGESGEIFILEDWCPHRGVPLSAGQIIGETIQCPYHGLQFDGSGRCVHNPHITGDPGALKARRFPHRVHQGGVWVWMGEADQTDGTAVPHFPEFDPESGFDQLRCYLHINANYQLVVDNLLDLSHAEYIHATTIGTKNSSQNVKSRAVNCESGVTVERRICNVSPSNQWKGIWTKSEKVDQVTDMTFTLPSILFMNTMLTTPDGGAEGAFRLPTLHILTPESESVTHYHFALARNYRLNDPEYSAMQRELILKAFTNEDAPILEAIQKNLNLSGEKRPFANFTPGDAGSRRARKLVRDQWAAVQSPDSGV